MASRLLGRRAQHLLIDGIDVPDRISGNDTAAWNYPACERQPRQGQRAHIL